ncbi:carbohydrate binding domain-containing protein [candidate division KSB1 bacterium]|nr:carbohydrate binding domain-containing protein [candidate division KSB1 bacterium]
MSRTQTTIWMIIIVGSVTWLNAQNFEEGFNFYLPPDDTTSQRFMPDFSIDPIESDEFVGIQEGHFAINGERIRFYGTNSVAAGAFPDQSKAPFVSGRLRKMGFNLIRFHHIDNGWGGPSLMEYGQDTRHLDPVTLDRLEKFIYELKRNGVYINMNLHVSRAFSTQDGVAAADSILNFGKGVTYFDPQLIALQKEYATQLLTHLNPYTGLALKDDPVMAMVEITNENSLYRMWRDGSIRWQDDGGDFPMFHVRILDDLWIEYLRSKYADTEALRAEWNQGLRPQGEDEQVRDGTFETDPINQNWVLEQHEGATANMAIDETSPFEGLRCAHVEVTNVTGTNWHIQWKQVDLSLVKDSLSTVTFAGRSDGNRNIQVSIQKDTDPWTVYYSATFQTNSEWQTFQFSFRAPDNNDQDTRLSFSLGDETGSYWFDDIHLGASWINGLEEDENLEEGSIRRIAYHECVSFSDNRVMDMSAFYKKLQDDYFVEMTAHLHGLGVQVPLTGTNWGVGPGDMAIQSELDYIDNHAYWDHPSFPNIPWSATDWTMNNQPMVRDENGGAIVRLLGGVPVAGKPMTLSEYNHPFPNRYQSEGVLFITGYAGFYDTDGPMFFDYGGSQYEWETDKVPGFFGIHRNTAMMSLIPSCALAFRMGMITPAEETIELAFSEKDILLLPKQDNLYWAGPDIFPDKLALEHAIRNVDFNSPQNINLDAFPPEPVSPYVSDTDEIVWDTDGLLQVNTKRFIGFTGFLQDYPNHTAGALTLRSATDFATLTWVSLTEDRLVDAEKSLFTISTTIQNSNMIWDGLITVHDSWGNAPTEMHPVSVTLGLFIHADSLHLYRLDETGEEMGAPTSFQPVGNNRFEITLDQTVDETVWWGLEKFGLGTAVDPDLDIQSSPTSWELKQNYPNPFNAGTAIPFTVAKKSPVRITIFNLKGQKIRTLLDTEKQAGKHLIHWDGKSYTGRVAASGVYVIEMKSDHFQARQKIVLLN